MIPVALSLSLVKPLLLLLGLAPAGWYTWALFNDQLGANPVEAVIHGSGQWGLSIVLLTLAMRPAKELLGWRLLMRFRRMVGLFGFFYLSIHLLLYIGLDQGFDWPFIWQDIQKRLYVTAGFAAFLLLVPLALTSNDLMVRTLGRRWKKLHKLVYPAAILGLLHLYWLTKLDYTFAHQMGAILAILLGYRLLQWGLKYRHAVAAAMLVVGIWQPLPASAAVERAEYQVFFDGVEGALEELLRQVSTAEAKREEPPLSGFLLRGRAKEDLDRLTAALHSRGYFDAQLSIPPFKQKKPPFALRFEVNKGPQYRLGSMTIEGVKPQSGFTPPQWQKLGLTPGEPALARRVLNAESQLIELAKTQGFAFAKPQLKEAWADPVKQSLDVTFKLQLGPRIQLAKPTLTGAKEVSHDYLQSLIAWQDGQWYHPEQLAKLRQKLVKTGLFRQVRIKLAKLAESPPLKAWPVRVELVASPHRTIKGGAGWQSDLGPRMQAKWSHRNWLGRGEGVTVGSALSIDNQKLFASLDKPHFRRPKQTLRLASSLEREIEDAYERLGLTLEGRLLMPWRNLLDLSMGAVMEMASLDDLSQNEQQSYATLSLALGVGREAVDDPLDAKQGYRFGLEMAPVVKLLGDGAHYFKLTGHATHYYQFEKHPELVLAGRLISGVTVGAESDGIPVDSRFYAGGGGTIRGYGHQLAGPLDSSNKAIGGRSRMVMNGEVRYGVTEKIGVVAFADAGRAFASSFPDGSAPLLVGVGGGVRYASPLGPFRLDIGLPTKQREGVDDPFQIYMSIGQAF
uniref:Protein-methionine-sulfoxide reductase heme-binding subunit MsrQ n=1 Tax=Magnetococcus massalia (strain MO-1) TaxID=451514 RepID=A0A1S7LEU9_MAGMO|nr:conserved membrane protein of unknown function [Candidatus Magnetococcus massalia]